MSSSFAWLALLVAISELSLLSVCTGMIPSRVVVKSDCPIATKSKPTATTPAQVKVKIFLSGGRKNLRLHRVCRNKRVVGCEQTRHSSQLTSHIIDDTTLSYSTTPPYSSLCRSQLTLCCTRTRTQSQSPSLSHTCMRSWHGQFTTFTTCRRRRHLCYRRFAKPIANIVCDASPSAQQPDWYDPAKRLHPSGWCRACWTS